MGGGLMSGMPGELIPGEGMPGEPTPPEGGGVEILELTVPTVMAVEPTKARSVPTAMAIALGRAGVVPTFMAIQQNTYPEHTVPSVMAIDLQRRHTVPTTMAIELRGIHAVPTVMAISKLGLHYIPTAMAIYKPLPIAARAPRRPTQLPYIMAALTSLFDLDPAAAPAITVTVGVGWRVDGDLLEVTGGASPFVCDLREYTMGTLAAALTTAGYTASASGAWYNVAATALLDGLGRFADSRSLFAFTSTLYRLLRSIVLVWDKLADDLDLGMAQLDLRQAEGPWLDFWGALYGVARQPVEGDRTYRARIIYLTLKPRANGVAIKDAIKAIFDIDATVADDSPIGVAHSTNDGTEMNRAFASGHTVKGRMWPGYPPGFTVTLPVGTPPPTLALIRDLVERFRAAGVRVTVKIAGS